MLVINAFVFYLEVGLKTAQKEQKLGEKFLKKSLFQVRAKTVKRIETRQGWKNSRTLPYYGMMATSSLASNAMHLHHYFTLYTTKRPRDASALR